MGMVDFKGIYTILKCSAFGLYLCRFCFVFSVVHITIF